ncbi:MAG TPA: Fe-S-binding domain-containing protein, partial [Planctomycetota bacterium]|nr:Fe-S-binding domain-containing protein [Planctomycetota bacterium]
MHDLTWLTFLPLLGALAVLCTPSGAAQLQRMLALATTLGVAVMGVMLYCDFDGSKLGAQFVVSMPWFEFKSG